MENYDEYLKQSKEYYDKRFGKDVSDAFTLNLEEVERWDRIKKTVETHFIKKKSDIDILDVGCGRGWLCQRLLTFGNVTGTDLSQEAINKAKENFPAVDFICVDAADDMSTTFKNKKFDLVISSEVIEHVAKQKEYFDNIITLLKEGGRLIITTPNAKWKQHHFYKERKAWAQPYEFWLTSEELLKLAEGKLKNVHVTPFNTNWIFDDRSFGLPNLLGLPLWRKFLALFKLKKKYLNFLEKRGYGLYLFFEGHK